MMTDDEFLNQIITINDKICLIVFGVKPGNIIRSGWDYILPYKQSFLNAPDSKVLYEIWNNAYFAKTMRNMATTYDKFPDYWNKFYAEMFNHASPIATLDLIEDKTYRLKSSNRRFKVCDGGDTTVVIQFLDDKVKIDLSREDFNNECELVKE